MKTTDKEFIDYILKLIQLLTKFGFRDWSERLNQALHISFMPGEILMAVRKVLIDLEKTEIPEVIKERIGIKEAIAILNKVLK